MNIASLAGFSLHLLALLGWGVTYINIIDANCLSSRDIIYLASSTSNYFFWLLFYTPSLLSVQIFNLLAFPLSVYIHTYQYIFYQSKSLFSTKLFSFFIAFMTESICLLIYTKREKYTTCVVLFNFAFV